MDTLNAALLSHATLRALHQAETLPLAQLCKQVQRENYQAWKRWETGLDYATTMYGRYGLFAPAELADCAIPRPAPDYDTLPLFAAVSHKEAPMDLLKLAISKDALIARETLHGYLTGEEMALLPTKRNDADNVRKALRYKLRPWQRFAHGGKTCKAEATETKGSGLDVWVYVKEVDDTSVGYTGTPICQVTDSGGRVQVLSTDRRYRAVLDAIGTAENLLAFGQTHYFEADVRELAQGLLEAVCVKFWPGVLLALTDEAHETAMAIQTLLGRFIAGQGKVTLMSLDNTPANREALARELAEGFTADFAKLTERCGHTAPMVESIQAAYDALAAKVSLAESVLGVEIDCLEAQVDVTFALSAAQAA